MWLFASGRHWVPAGCLEGLDGVASYTSERCLYCFPTIGTENEPSIMGPRAGRPAGPGLASEADRTRLPWFEGAGYRRPQRA